MRSLSDKIMEWSITVMAATVALGTSAGFLAIVAYAIKQTF